MTSHNRAHWICCVSSQCRPRTCYPVRQCSLSLQASAQLFDTWPHLHRRCGEAIRSRLLATICCAAQHEVWLHHPGRHHPEPRGCLQYCQLVDTHSQLSVMVQISTMGDPEGQAKGGFLLFDQDLKVHLVNLDPALACHGCLLWTSACCMLMPSLASSFSKKHQFCCVKDVLTCARRAAW